MPVCDDDSKQVDLDYSTRDDFTINGVGSPDVMLVGSEECKRMRRGQNSITIQADFVDRFRLMGITFRVAGVTRVDMFRRIGRRRQRFAVVSIRTITEQIVKHTYTHMHAHK